MALTDKRHNGDPVARKMVAALDDAGVDVRYVEDNGLTVRLRSTADAHRLTHLLRAMHA